MKEPTLEEIMAADVNKRPSNPEQQQIEQKIEQVKPKKITLTLEPYEWDIAQRNAKACGLDPKDWLLRNIHELLTDRVGKARITGPSGATHNKVTGPSPKVAWK